METSCGVVLVNYGTVLLLQYPQGHWDLPKGHVEEDDGNYQFMSSGGTIEILDTGHSVTSGISSFSFTSRHVEFEDAIDSGAEKLGTASTNSNACTICVHDHGSNGKTGYLGGQYMSNPNSYNTSSMRSGVEDQLLEQMVYWLGN